MKCKKKLFSKLKKKSHSKQKKRKKEMTLAFYIIRLKNFFFC